MNHINQILSNRNFEKGEIIELLQSEGEERRILQEKAREIRVKEVGDKVYFRGLVEFSNVCSKDCFYCGIRKSNKEVIRYNVPDDEILAACRFAWENGFGSVVLQSGEISTPTFVKRVDHFLKEIKKLSNNELGITLSCGEQTKETYRRWFESGAHRYLLRIEASNKELYYKIHPNNKKHNFEQRLEFAFIFKRNRLPGWLRSDDWIAISND